MNDDEFKSRLSAAKSTRMGYIKDASREVYKYCFNGREQEWDMGSKGQEPDEIFTDFPAVIAEEFHGELFSTMTPENAPWVGYEPGNAVSKDDWANGLEDQFDEFGEIMDQSIRSSNYYTEGQTAFQDAVVGNVAMWVERRAFGKPIRCEAIAIPKLELRIGPNGIEDRFRTERYIARDLPSLLPDADFPKELKDKIKRGSSAHMPVIWGFWRDYSDPLAPRWYQAIRVDGKEVGLDRDIGEEGACPLIVGRFNGVPNSPWGRGPGRTMLPTIRTLDVLCSMNLEAMDRNLDPAYAYPHDGILDLSDGIESGMGYPSMPGSAESIRPIGTIDNLDYGFFSEEKIEEKVRYGFYREMLQRGKTPPSASQYLGEAQKQIQRMARPAATLWEEFGVGILKRFEYLERQRGGLLFGVPQPLIEGGTVSVRPISPLERAQAREDVMVAQSIMETANATMGPQQAAMMIDGAATTENIKAKLKDKLVVTRSAEDQMRMMQAQAAAMAPPSPEAPNGQG
ncbi:MAG: hypothetical protein JXQ91_07685 [Vannielia sp.]|uniref:portal protein n=1 Tax=Vannielia sp. TaxID=2813045 RepID=UPI003B8D6D9B